MNLHWSNFARNAAQDANQSGFRFALMLERSIDPENAASSEALAENIINASQNIDVYKIGQHLQYYSNVNGILICFVIIKFLNYIEKFNKGMGMLFEVVAVAKNEVQYFAIIIAIIMLAFACSFVTAFGSHHA